jgi:hypothetical protein
MYKKQRENHLFVGFRYGASSFNYDVETTPLQDPIWPGQTSNPDIVDGIWGGSLPYRHTGLKGSMQWFELVAGVRVQIFKDFMMGWTVRKNIKPHHPSVNMLIPGMYPVLENMEIRKWESPTHLFINSRFKIQG